MLRLLQLPQRPRLLLLALLAAGLAGCWVVELPTDTDAGLSLDMETGDVFPWPGEVDTCQPGQTYCVGQTHYRCDAAGKKWITEDCKKAGKNCLREEQTNKISYSCSKMICQPKSGSCADDGLTTLVCSEDGSRWVKGQLCDLAKKGQHCRRGKCDEACGPPLVRHNIGCHFYTANLHNWEAYKVAVMVYNPGKLPAKLQLRNGTRDHGQAVLQPGTFTTIEADVGSDMLQVTSGLKKGWGWGLHSNVPVVAWQLSPNGISPDDKYKQRSGGGSVLLPIPALDKQYFVFTAPVSHAEDMAYVAVVATDPDTSVTVTPTVDIKASEGIPAVKKGQPYTTTLQIYDLLVLGTDVKGADLTGTRVKSNKRVVVYGGNACATVPAGKDHCDHLQEQMLPVDAWTASYVAANFMPRGTKAEDNVWRIMAGLKSAKVTINRATSAPVIKTLSPGQFFELSTNEAMMVSATGQVSLAHFAVGQAAVTLPLNKALYSEGFDSTLKCPTSSTQGNLGDPAMTITVPSSQHRTEYDVLVPKNYKYDFLTITMSAKTSAPLIMLDGKLLTRPMTRIRGTYAFYTHVRVTDGLHKIRSNVPVGVEVHGYDCNTAYAYSGGMLLQPYTPF